MSRFLVCAIVLLIATSACAQNIYVSAYVSFDSTYDIDRVDPEPYTSDRIYICLDWVDDGMTAVYLAVAIDAGVSDPAVWTNLLPGGATTGDWSTGVQLHSSECVGDGLVCVARGELFYLGGAGQITLVDHPTNARWVVDCHGLHSFFAICHNAGVFMDPYPSGEECGPIPYNPVEASSWGMIKGLYQE